jgi:hypothetical protein
LNPIDGSILLADGIFIKGCTHRSP